MVENVEQIEAMLAAYIDDELTPDERAELERHLEANPSHRGLILELTGHRDLLRSLPREPAPEDLSEHLEGAIERDALLGGGDPLTEFRTARTRRWWPQLLAAAAIFILAFGLAAIVFYVLPPKHPTVAIVQPPEFEAGLEATRDEREQRIAQRMKESVAEKDVTLAADAIAQSNTTTPELGAEARTLMEASAAGGGGGGIAGGREATDALASAPAQDGTLVITITANDVQQASSELMTYFTTNGIAWSEPANREAVVTLAKAVKTEQGDLGSVRLAMENTPPPPAPTGVGDRNEPALEVASGVAVQEVERVAPQDTAAATPAPSQERATRDRRAMARSAPAAAPTTTPARPSGGAEAVATQALAGNTPGTSAGTPGTERYVVLAALSGTQAERLASTFGRRAELRREAVAIPAVKQIAAPVASRPTRGIQVGLKTQEKLDEALRADAAEFKLVRPATQPAVDPTNLWMLQDETLKATTTTQPVEPFQFRVTDLGRELEGPVFNCVVVLRKPEEGGPATQPSTPVTGAAAATQPVGPSR